MDEQWYRIGYVMSEILEDVHQSLAQHEITNVKFAWINSSPIGALDMDIMLEWISPKRVTGPLRWFDQPAQDRCFLTNQLNSHSLLLLSSSTFEAEYNYKCF